MFDGDGGADGGGGGETAGRVRASKTRCTAPYRTYTARRAPGASAAQASHTRVGSRILKRSSRARVWLHPSQKALPQRRQWWRRLRTPNSESHE